MGKINIEKKYGISTKRIREMFFQLKALPDRVYEKDINERKLLSRLSRLLKVKKENEKRFLSFVVYSTFRAN